MTRVSRGDVIEAADRIAGLVEHTPLIETKVGGKWLLLKCECLQTGGAFKLRGASNRLAMLSESERQAGVVAFSSGNHARGVAIAARRLGIPAVIVRGVPREGDGRGSDLLMPRERDLFR